MCLDLTVAFGRSSIADGKYLIVHARSGTGYVDVLINRITDDCILISFRLSCWILNKMSRESSGKIGGTDITGSWWWGYRTRGITTGQKDNGTKEKEYQKWIK